MAEGLAKAKKLEAAAASSPRTIEFHPARKPFSPIARAGGDFHLETLNSRTDSRRPAPSPRGPAASAASASASASGKKRSDRGEFYEHGLDSELSFRITFRRIGAGLQNLGNTCFLNSVLQCLTYTEPFAAYLQSGKHKSSCHTTGFCAMCALQSHVMVALQSTGKILSPSHIVKNLRCISRNFRNYRQEDAHEYMVNLLESMHKCCLPSGVPSESPSAYEKSLVHKIFGGRLRSQVKCMQCSYCSNKFDPFLDLSLEIVKPDSLRKALAHFTEVEQLDGGRRQYQCQRCKEKVRALKQLTIDKAPYVLTIHLKRFGSCTPGQKINKKVEFEPTLDLKPFVNDAHVSEGNLKYTLYGVLVHAGWSTHSGHYYCYVRTSSGMWHSLDDNQVSQVSEKTVLAQKAYMLFYVRDRSSSIKRSVDVAHKDNLSSNGPVNELVTRSAATSNGAVKNSGVERRLSTAECISAKIKSDCNRQSDFVGGTSSDHLLQEVVSSLHNSQNSGQVVPKDASNLHRNGGVISDGLQQTTLPAPKKLPFCKDLKMPVVTSTRDQKLEEDLAQPALLKDNTVTTTDHGSDTSFIHGVQSNDRFHLCNGCNADMKSDILTARPNDAASPKTTEKHTKKLLTENNMMESKNKPSIFPNQSSPMKQSIRKGVSSEEHVEQQATGSENKYSSNMPCQNDEESLLKLSETGLVNLSTKQSTSNGYGQKEAFAETGREHSVGQFCQTERQLKKLAKYSLRGMYLGRKRLFFASLRLPKGRKGKRSRKHQLSSRNMTRNGVLDDLGINEQTTSTSQAIKAGIHSMHSHKKRSHSSSIKDNNSQGANDNSYCNGDSADTDRQIEERNDKNISMLAASKRAKRCLGSAANQCNSRETDANEKGPQQHEFMSLLMRGLKETTVAQWNDLELAMSEAQGPENSRNNSIGYVPDKRDEEYDRGKVKKVKKCRQSFDGPNPFQETSNVKAQQKMKVDYTRSGNQPFRI